MRFAGASTRDASCAVSGARRPFQAHGEHGNEEKRCSSKRGDEAQGDDCTVVLSNNALIVYLSVSSKRDIEAIDHRLELLQVFPYLGQPYRPLYDAAQPAFPVYVTYAGSHYGIYYEVSEDERRVTVDFIEDQRRNPAERFSDTAGFYGEPQEG